MDSAILSMLASYKAPGVFNPWRDTDPLDFNISDAAALRRTRLAAHFACDPEFMLIGEAPGYQGCHFSGVAFTNEKLILSGAIPRVTSTARITTRPVPWSEPSATIVWGTLRALGIAHRTVLWNAFAWHPHKDERLSNRAPSRAELLAGLPVLKAVMAQFRHAKVIAVGNVAADILESLSIKVVAKVRHPAMGGATKFRQGMAEFSKPLQGGALSLELL